MDYYAFIILPALVGAFRGGLSLVFEHPLDVIKTYWQANPHKLSIISVIRSIVFYKGLLGFYSGAIPNVMRVVFKQAYRYPLMLTVPLVYNAVCSSVFMVSVLTGLTIAVIEVWLLTPLERLKVWLVTFKQNSKGVITFFKTSVRVGVVSQLYKGLNISLVRQVTSWTVFLVVHDQLMLFVKAMNIPPNELPVLWLLGVAFVEGGVNTLVVQPLDCLKTHIQKVDSIQGYSILSIFSLVFKQYGFRGLYIGWQVRLFQYMVHALFTISVLEHLKQICYGG